MIFETPNLIEHVLIVTPFVGNDQQGRAMKAR